MSDLTSTIPSPIPPPPPPPAPVTPGEGRTPGSDREGVDRVFTLSAQAALAQQAASGSPGRPPVATVPAGELRSPSVADQRRVDRAAARAERVAEKRDRRAEKTAFLRRPVPVDRSWAKWVAGGLLLVSACGFVWRVSERKQPYTLVQVGQQAAATATSGVAAVTTNPLQGIGKPMSNLAAAVIGSYDPGGRTLVVPTSSGDVRLGVGRVEDLAGQVWAFGPTDPCTIYITSPDPRQSPKAVKKVDGQPLPAGATPLFDCSAPVGPAGAATATSVAGG